MNNSGKSQLAQGLLAPEANEIRVKHDELSIHTVFIPIHRFFIPLQPSRTTAPQCFSEKKSSIHSLDRGGHRGATRSPSALTRFSSRFIAFSSLLIRQEPLHPNALQRKNHPFILWIGGHRGVPSRGDQRSALSSPPRPWWGSSSRRWPLGVRPQATPALRISPRLRSQVRLLRTEPS